jgi:hypothetical protein
MGTAIEIRITMIVTTTIISTKVKPRRCGKARGLVGFRAGLIAGAAVIIMTLSRGSVTRGYHSE